MGRPNPDYGRGIFRRRIRVRAEGALVAVDLEDNNHGFRLRLRHDGQAVSAVEVDSVRHPFGTCPEAVRPLQRIVGHRLADGVQALRERLVPGEHCTHMFDMAMLAVAHAGGADECFEYDIAVHDETDAPARAEIRRDGELVHAWTVRARELVEPGALAGRPMMRGFHAWASQAFAGDALEAAGALQRGFFVAQARRYTFEPPAQNPASADGMAPGACYSYGAGVVERAFRSGGTVRDYTHAPERLLRFDPPSP